MAKHLRPRFGASTRGAIAIMAGTGLGQLMAVGASPILSRLYTPEHFGIFSVVNALAMILGSAMALRYEMAIPLPKEDSDARALVALGLSITLTITILATACLILVPSTIAATLGAPGLTSWLMWIPAISACLASFRLLNQWALRQRRFRATARRNVISATTTIAVQLIAGWRFAGAGGLVAGLGFGQALGAVSLLPRSRLTTGASWRSTVRLARRYRRFPLLLTPAGLLNSAGLYVPVLLVAALYGAESAGWLGFTQRILAFPLTLIGQAIAQVYLSELALRHRTSKGRQLQLFTRVSQRLALLALSMAAILILAAHPAFLWAFGESWGPSGSMARALSIALAFQLLASPLSPTLVVYERLAIQLSWDFARVTLLGGGILTAFFAGADVLVAVWIYSAISAAMYALSWWLSYRTLDGMRE